MTASFYSALFNIHRNGVLTSQGWCHIKLLPSRRKFCVHHTTMRHFTVSLYSRQHMSGACVLAVTCHLHLWHNDQDRLRATAVTRGRGRTGGGRGRNEYQNKSQHRKLTPEKNFSSHSCGDSKSEPFDHESGALTTELYPIPIKSHYDTHISIQRVLLRPLEAILTLAHTTGTVEASKSGSDTYPYHGHARH